MKTTSAFMLALIAAGSGEALADVAGNVTLATDYRFRGISQTDRDPALSGGFDIAAENGLYAGTWASNVQFGGSIEVDYYAGWKGDIAEDVALDVGYVYYNYPSDNANPDLDYQEIYGKLSFVGITGSLFYSNDFFAETGTYWYLSGDYSHTIVEGVTAGLHLGYNAFDSENDLATFLVSLPGEDPGDGYVDWQVDLTTSLWGADWSVAYVDSNIEDDECGGTQICDATLVLSVSKAL